LGVDPKAARNAIKTDKLSQLRQRRYDPATRSNTQYGWVWVDDGGDPTTPVGAGTQRAWSGPLREPRLSIARLMLGVAVAAFPPAVVGSVMADRPMLGLADCLDMGVLPGVMVLMIGLSRIILRRRCGRFAVGFQAAGLAAVVAYVACCRLFPEFM